MARFAGERISPNPVRVAKQVTLEAHGNSGAGAIALAVQRGATRVVLLGYDCQHTGGKAHWHADHPRGMANARRTDSWARRFAELAEQLAGQIDVINASRATALTCFRRSSLEEALHD